jgi:hypothetical protein
MHLNENFKVLCAGAPGWKEQLLREMQNTYDQVGATSFVHDQFFEWFFCHDRTHGHKPQEACNHLARFGGQARQWMRSKNPAALFGGEYVTDYGLKLLDFYWNWQSPQDADEARPFKYIFPWCLPNANVDHSITIANEIFAEGYQLNVIPGMGEKTLRDYPSFKNHLKKLAAAKSRNQGFLVDGCNLGCRYLDVESGKSILYKQEKEYLLVSTGAGDKESHIDVRFDLASIGLEPGAVNIRTSGLDGETVDSEISRDKKSLRMKTNCQPEEVIFMYVSPKTGF